MKARITLDDASKIGKYTCMAQHGSENSASAVVTMEQGGHDCRPENGMDPNQRRRQGNFIQLLFLKWNSDYWRSGRIRLARGISM